jgi:hypothetical protein
MFFARVLASTSSSLPDIKIDHTALDIFTLILSRRTTDLFLIVVICLSTGTTILVL